MRSLSSDLLRNTVSIFRGCKSPSVLASLLGLAEKNLVSLIELWDMAASSVGECNSLPLLARPA